MQYFKKAVVIFLFCHTYLLNLYSQELLPNGNFEINFGYPTSWGQAYLLKYWRGSSGGKWSPINYFNDLNVGYVPTRKDGGSERPYSGHGFIGLGIAFKTVEKTGSQYFEIELLSPLEKNSIYVITAFVSLADKMHYALDYIPVALSDKRMLRSDGQPLYMQSYIKLRSDEQYLDKTVGWTKISAIYKAKGGEHYFIIGGIQNYKNLDSGFQIKKMPLKLSLYYFITERLTYYFVDNISIQKQILSTTPRIVDLRVLDSISLEEKKEDRIIINNVAFALNSSHLKDTLNAQLDSLASMLITHNKYKIKILGYTDDLGSERFNDKLSEIRAKTIYNYLNKRGVSSERMRYKGFGESNPIYKNNSEEGRAKNRRVEILISE